jgi:tetratricopeptide (TPR) repeat protein
MKNSTATRACIALFHLNTLILILGLTAVHARTAETDSLEQVLANTEGEARIEILHELSRLNSHTEPTKSLDFAKEAVELARQYENPFRLSNALNALAISHYYLGNISLSIGYLQESIKILEDLWQADTTNFELLFRISLLSGNASNAYSQQGEFDKALEMLLRERRFSEKLIGIKPENIIYQQQLMNCLSNLSTVYRELNKFHMAEEMLTNALRRCRETNYNTGIAACLNNLGLLRIEQERFREAMEIFEEALQLNMELADSIAIAGNYNNIGLIMENTEDFQQSLHYYKSSLKITERLKYAYGISNTSNNIGKIYQLMGRPDSAEVFILKGLETARKNGLLTLEMQSLNTLSSLYRSTGNFRQALDVYQDYSIVKDSLFNLERTMQIADMETKYETEKKERENIILRKDIRLHKTTQRFLFLAVFTLVLLTIMLYFLMRAKNRLLRQKTDLFEQQKQIQSMEIEKKEMERKYFENQVFAEQEINRLQKIKLEEQNRKLAATAIQVTTKNKILESILQEIDQASKSKLHEPDECYRNIRKTVRANMNLDRDWEQFKRHFEAVHPEFFIKLTERYPNLTPGEQKICAYYRINLGTNEIAQILNVTLAAVRKSRYRLRKKLEVESLTKMNEFMLSI